MKQRGFECYINHWVLILDVYAQRIPKLRDVLILRKRVETMHRYQIQTQAMLDWMVMVRKALKCLDTLNSCTWCLDMFTVFPGQIRRMQNSTEWCRTVQNDVGQCSMMQDSVGWCRTVQNDEGQCMMMQESLGWCRTVHDETELCRMVQDSAGWKSCEGWYTTVPDDKGQSVQDDAGKYSMMQDSER